MFITWLKFKIYHHQITIPQIPVDELWKCCGDVCVRKHIYLFFYRLPCFGPKNIQSYQINTQGREPIRVIPAPNSGRLHRSPFINNLYYRVPEKGFQQMVSDHLFLKARLGLLFEDGHFQSLLPALRTENIW